MRGVGHSSGAVTIVNALPTGFGCAVAVSLPVRADLELRRTAESGTDRVQIDRAADSALVRETLHAGLSRFAQGEGFSGELRLTSHVPVGRGLKSSSAVSVAVLAAVADALSQDRSAVELARLASEVAQEIGLSATGAFDDCLASLQGGLVLTDNSSRTALRARPFDPGLEVILWIPRSVHGASTSYLDRFREHAAAGAGAVGAARAGDWPRAMNINTTLVERVMGYQYGELRESLLRAGAFMAGVSGMGPALAAFVTPDTAPGVQARMPDHQGEILRVRVRPDESGSLGGP